MCRAQAYHDERQIMDASGLDMRDEWARWLRAAGFTPPASISLPAWIGSALIVTGKPHAA
jgi:hypothetical protein